MACQTRYFPDEEIGNLIEQIKQLTFALPELELVEDPNDAIIVASLKLVGKVLSKMVIKKHQVVNALNKAWNLKGDFLVTIMD